MIVGLHFSRKMRRRRFMKKRKLLKKFAAGVMAAALCVTGLNTAFAAPDGLTDYDRSPSEIVLDGGTVPYPSGIYTYPSSDPLFAATKFHVFAEDSASIQTHCNGNIATKFLYQQSNSGSNTVYDTQLPEVSYIRKLDENSVINFGPNTQVVFGDETHVYSKEGNEVYIDTYESSADDTANVKKIETSKQADGTFRVFTEAGSADNERFINFDKEFEKLSKLSHNLAHESTTAGVSINENVVDLGSVSGTAYINVTPNDLMNRAFIVDNTDFTNNQAIVINVDLGTLTDYTLPFTQVLFKEDGVSFGTGEDKGDYTGHGNVLWNFYGRDENGHVVNYTGTLRTCSEFKGTILAPDAAIWCASSNQDGNFIGREVHLGGGQTHRWDFGGTLKTYPDSYGSLQVIVTEETSGNPVGEVEIYIYDKGDEDGDPVAKVVTDATGKTVVIGEIPVGKEFTAIVKEIPYGYILSTDADDKPIDKATEAIDSTDLHKIYFTVKEDTTAPEEPETGYIKVIVKDADTGSYLEDITVLITDINGDDISGGTPFVTDDFGSTHTEKITITGTDADDFVVSIPSVPEGYITPSSKDVTVDGTNPNVVIFELSKKQDTTPKGSIQVKVFEKGTTNPIQNAIVSVNDSVGHVIKEVTVVTDDAGETEVVGSLPTTTTYETELIGIPDGYKLDSGDSKTQSSIVVKENETTVVTYYLVKKEGALKVQVVDENNNPVSGVEAVITNDGAAVTGGNLTTGTDGYSDAVEHLVIGDTYTATITESTIPSDYELVTTNPQEKKIEGEDVVTLTFVVKEKTPTPTPTGKLVVVVEDEDGNPIDGVVVDIKDGATAVEKLTTGSTGTDGTTDVCDDLTIDKTYTATVDESTIPTGYELVTTNPQEKKIVDESLVTITFVIKETPVTPPTPTPTGKLVVVVEDEDGNPIDDVVVDIKDGATAVEKLTTGSTGTDGTTDVCDELTIDKTYTATVDESTIPTGYELVTTNPQEKKIVDESLVTITFVIKETPVTPPTPEKGKIEVVITDKNTGEPIPGATVVIKNPDGSIKETVTT
ncbi:MAG: choice-of-anchor A family protein, partial [Lachnospiraceae bacterium]|nr:choice-of-anchor A family protein [Lachnospiraceae bacterium]